MLLVPKQLKRVGMTGSVAYYGGRLTPAQAYAASHPSVPPPTFADPMTTGGGLAARLYRRREPTFPHSQGPMRNSRCSSSWMQA